MIEEYIQLTIRVIIVALCAVLVQKADSAVVSMIWMALDIVFSALIGAQIYRMRHK